MEMFTRSVSLTPPTNPETTSIVLKKFPYARLISKAFGGVTTRFYSPRLAVLVAGCPLLVILIARVHSLIFTLHLVGVNPAFRASIAPKTQRQRPPRIIILGECHLLFGEASPPKTTSAQQHSALYIFFLHGLRKTSSPCHPRQHGQPGRWEWPGRLSFSELRCAPGNPETSTFIAPYYEWILDTLRSSDPFRNTPQLV